MKVFIQRKTIERFEHASDFENSYNLFLILVLMYFIAFSSLHHDLT